eukprot:CAMPEP_0201617724 /NCGR_PEP_ID=MMETSP0492-20130828/37091_1 /ASSEMBLY_ACC=CAM_ASM_000837 /TAXON_ID=420259 /ORGANISM="Thalassiosira gravida, Strain GMp14c1" /LENGTH=78 /DNA_ID=CAMNT_0048086067 /DNA_START=614 /DNA_END=851 /DNA_ORIENTATION=+
MTGGEQGVFAPLPIASLYANDGGGVRVGVRAPEANRRNPAFGGSEAVFSDRIPPLTPAGSWEDDAVAPVGQSCAVYPH